MLFLVCLLMLVTFGHPQHNGAGPVKHVDRNKFLGRYYHVCELRLTFKSPLKIKIKLINKKAIDLISNFARNAHFRKCLSDLCNRV